ncbi:DUF429 domain-containing protein [Xanthobacter agilis]|uniref:DUF429 domain-containing protein n=1 Tax=Xanthobacter agilis TaxID=47492 RepID=UPI003728184B
MKKAEAAVLGIDAAWTEANPSGVALVGRFRGAWRLLEVAGSYQAFLDRGQERGLTGAAERLAGLKPAVVAVDMPMSRLPITARRVADNAVSRAFGARKCGTHTPSAVRPGGVGRRLQDDLARDGYELGTLSARPPCVIEVYPHPALLTLTGAPERVPYKVGKIRSYWPDVSAAERRSRLMVVWSRIVGALDARIEGVARAMPLPDAGQRGAELKAYEDRLDAVVCAWVGIEVLEGRARPFGDETAAIWIPEVFGLDPAG